MNDIPICYLFYTKKGISTVPLNVLLPSPFQYMFPIFIPKNPFSIKSSG